MFKKKRHPKLTIPESRPLSPCIIEQYVDNEGKKEENKAYIPVSLLISALGDDRMLNIAVAGNYGVGKSSIINTAEKQVCRKHKFIKISLASLLTQEGKASQKEQKKEAEPGDEHKSSTKDGATNNQIEGKPHGKEIVANSLAVSDKQIEYSILQQLLYHDRPQKTPKSRIRRIHKTSKQKPYWIAAGILMVFVSLVLLLQPAWFISAGFINLDNASELAKLLVKWGPITVLAIAIIRICVYFSQHYSFSLSRIGYKNIEMKITDEVSIFNAYLDEIVYFFESTEYDVVVFEDLDRFSNKEIIFFKLRELNTILNNCQSLGRKINFVYAVLDHLFDAAERVKFFDYIITVIPVINSLNSYDKLKECISPPELFQRLGHTELLNLCDYLQDMRLLLNIVNEFNQLSPLMDKSVMSYKVLFGLVVYKNYAPEDFSKMYNKDGIVAKLIEGADNCRASVIEDLEKKVEELSEKIRSFEKEYNQDIATLRLSYLEKGKALSDHAARITRIQVAGTPYSFESVAEQQGVFNAVRAGQAHYVLISSGNTIPITSFETIDANMGGVGHFEDETKKYKAEYERNTDEALKKIDAIKDELSRLPKTVSGIYQKSLTTLNDLLQGFNDPEKIRLVKFLILNGYLDRYYQYYISYFYPNSLKPGDQPFVMRAGRHEGPQFDVKLEAIDEVIKRFTPENFATNLALLNVDIVRALFNRTTQIPQAYAYKNAICSLISTENCLDFLLTAFRSSNPVPDAFYSMVLRKFDFWNQIDGRVQSEQDELHEIYIKYCDLQEGKVNPEFLEWLAENYAFIDKRWGTVPMERIEKLFKTCNPVFKTLSLKNTPDTVLQDIIESDRYVISRQNVNAIVARLGFLKEYRSASYVTLRDKKCTKLLRTLGAEWPNTLSKVFPDTSVHEDLSAMVSILNAALRYPSRTEFKSYLSRQDGRISDSSLLDDRILKYAFEQSLVQPTWRNVYYYAIIKGYGLPHVFLHNNTFIELVGESLSTEEEDALRNRIVFTNDVRISDYKKLVLLFSAPFVSIPFLIQPARMKFLLDNNMLAFNKDNYQIIRDHYSLSSQFIVNNLETFLSNPVKYEIDKTDVHAVWDALPTKKSKCNFIRAIKDNDVAPDTDLASKMRPFVVSSDLKINELGSKLLLAIISGAPDNNRIIIGRRAIVSLPYTRELTTLILSAMGNEFNRLTTETATSTITYSRDAIYICNELVRLGYVRSCEKKGSKIHITKV